MFSLFFELILILNKVLTQDHFSVQILKRLIFRTIAMQTEPALNAKSKAKREELISAPEAKSVLVIYQIDFKFGSTAK